MATRRAVIAILHLGVAVAFVTPGSRTDAGVGHSAAAWRALARKTTALGVASLEVRVRTLFRARALLALMTRRSSFSRRRPAGRRPAGAAEPAASRSLRGRERRPARARDREAIGMQDEGEARILEMRVGRIAESWTGNCPVAGLSQGFIEPLEATALHIVITTALDFADAYEKGGYGSAHRDRFNQRIAAKYEGIRDYIVAHYRLNQRSDTQYWRDNAANDALSEYLKGMITAWFTHEDLREVNLRQHDGNPHYASMSWHALFAGYGTFPPEAKMVPTPPELVTAEVDHTRRTLSACATNFLRYAPLSD